MQTCLPALQYTLNPAIRLEEAAQEMIVMHTMEHRPISSLAFNSNQPCTDLCSRTDQSSKNNQQVILSYLQSTGHCTLRSEAADLQSADLGSCNHDRIWHRLYKQCRAIQVHCLCDMSQLGASSAGGPCSSMDATSNYLSRDRAALPPERSICQSSQQRCLQRSGNSI